MDALRTRLRDHILERLEKKARLKELDISQLDDDENLFEFGVIDSLGFLDLVASLEERFALELDFSELEPEQFTTVNGLVLQCLAAEGR